MGASCLQRGLALWELPFRLEVILLPFFKKGDRKLCSNYRGISLINVVAKAFAVLLLRRFQRVHDLRTRPSQGGFRPDRGCVDQIFSLRRTLEQRWAYQQPTVLFFVDFAAAFDSVDRDSLWHITRADGMLEKLLQGLLPVDASPYTGLWWGVGEIWGEEWCAARMCPILYPLQLGHRLHPRHSPSGLRWDWGWSECQGVWSGLRGRHRLGRVEQRRCAGRAQPGASCSPGCGYDHKCLEDQRYAISGGSSQLAAIDTWWGQSGGRAVFCLSRLNNNAVHGYERVHLSSHCPDDPPRWLRNVAT